MGIVIFTREIAEELIARGFPLIDKTAKAWHFEDSSDLRQEVEQLLEILDSY